MTQTKQAYTGVTIEIEIGKYGLFEGYELAPDGMELNERATQANFEAAALETLQQWYPGAEIEFSYEGDSNRKFINVTGLNSEENSRLECEIERDIETEPLYDFQDESLYVYSEIEA